MKNCRHRTVFGFSLLISVLFLCKSASAFVTAPHSKTPAIAKTMKLSASSTAETEIKEDQVQLSSGVSMKVEWALPSDTNSNFPPLIFLHGSFHGGWCWTEHFFPYFLSLGYPVAAVNWRGTGGTFAGEGVKKVQIELHVQDLKAFLEEFAPKLASEKGTKPILISHSFGGLSIMKYLEEYSTKGLESIGGAVVMCSVPPSGNGKMTMRFLRQSLRASWKITKGLAMKKVLNDPDLCRELFFGGLDDKHDVSDEDVARYQRYFSRDSEATIDLLDLAKKLPSAQTDKNGQALFLTDNNGQYTPPFLVIGATGDYIVDEIGVQETAQYFGADLKIIDSPHDVMLGRNWKNAANEISQWLEKVR